MHACWQWPSPEAARRSLVDRACHVPATSYQCCCACKVCMQLISRASPGAWSSHSPAAGPGPAGPATPSCRVCVCHGARNYSISAALASHHAYHAALARTAGPAPAASHAGAAAAQAAGATAPAARVLHCDSIRTRTDLDQLLLLAAPSQRHLPPQHPSVDLE